MAVEVLRPVAAVVRRRRRTGYHRLVRQRWYTSREEANNRWDTSTKLVALAVKTADTKRQQTGAQLVAPPFDLVAVAKKLGRLSDIRERLSSSGDESNEEGVSQRATMLALIAMASGDFAAANEYLDKLVAASDSGDEAEHFDRWPEMLAVWIAMRHPETKEVARELIEALSERVRQGKLGESDAWKRHLATLAAAGRFQDELTAFGHEVLTEPLQQWQAVSHVSARSRGEGFPRSRWQRLPHRIDNVSAHDRDYLYFQSPLRGNFQVECDVASTFGRRESHLAYGGTFTSAWDSLSHYGSGGLREQSRGGVPTLFDPRLTHPGDWMRYRFAVADGRMKVYFNGRLIREQVLSDDRDPWLAIRNHWERSGAVRDMRITGDPAIPAEVKLAVSRELSGWLPYYDETVGAADADWRFENGELVGRSSTVTRSVSEERTNVPREFLADASGYDSARERLLHYHRPMLEDGTVDYEFYYELGQSHVHPAVDRLTFLLEPEGIRVHWATHGEQDETGLDTANTIDEPQNRRGPDRLPLLPGDWNKVRLTLSGDTIALALNGQLVFERELRLMVESHDKAVTNIVWKRLTVHAEKITRSKTEELAGDFKLDANTPQARFVRVDLPNKRNVLMLAEVEVFSNGKNIAIGKAARQSSVDWDAPAKLAVDGNKNGHFSLARSTTHTKYDLEPWWEVDLGKDYDVERILVWNRSDFGKERLHGFRVELLDNDRKRVWGNTDDPNEILADLNKQRDKLATRFAHDFAKNNSTADRLRRWGDDGWRSGVDGIGGRQRGRRTAKSPRAEAAAAVRRRVESCHG